MGGAARLCLDRYAARCANFVLVVTRIAVLGARSAPRETGNQPRGAGISRGRAHWLVLLTAMLLPSAAFFGESLAQTPAVTGTIALTGARLIDGTGRAPIEQATLLIRDGRIEAAGSQPPFPFPPAPDASTCPERQSFPASSTRTRM